MMKIILFSKEKTLIEEISQLRVSEKFEILEIQTQKPLSDSIELLQITHPDIVIIDDDLVLPDSERLIESIRKFDDSIGVVFVTSNSGIELGRKISQLGIQYYAHKPVDRGVLKEVVLSLTRRFKKRNKMNKRFTD
ncbi:MAG: response regulator [Calditrichaeota bacterium]|nr:response regulator [Calditrichota bacterium]